jgi:hypothetical protein
VMHEASTSLKGSVGCGSTKPTTSIRCVWSSDLGSSDGVATTAVMHEALTSLNGSFGCGPTKPTPSIRCDWSSGLTAAVCVSEVCVSEVFLLVINSQRLSGVVGDWVAMVDATAAATTGRSAYRVESSSPSPDGSTAGPVEAAEVATAVAVLSGRRLLGDVCVLPVTAAVCVSEVLWSWLFRLSTYLIPVDSRGSLSSVALVCVYVCVVLSGMGLSIDDFRALTWIAFSSGTGAKQSFVPSEVRIKNPTLFFGLLGLW